MVRKRFTVISKPPLFSDDADEAETFHRKFVLVAVVDTETFLCLVWFEISFPLNDDGFPAITEADLFVICLGSDFLAAVLGVGAEGRIVDVSFPGFAVEWWASVFTFFTFPPISIGFVV